MPGALHISLPWVNFLRAPEWNRYYVWLLPLQTQLSCSLPSRGPPAPIPAPFSVRVFAGSALESVWTCFTFQWFFFPPLQSPRFKFSFKHGSELGSCCSFSVSVRCGWGGLLVVCICPLAGRFPQAFHASMLPTDHVTQPQVSEVAWKYISFSFVQFPRGKKKGHRGSGRECVCIHSHQNCLKKGWRAEEMA